MDSSIKQLLFIALIIVLIGGGVTLYLVKQIGTGDFSFYTSRVPIVDVKDDFERSKPAKTQKVIGNSVEGRTIEAYTFGSGDHHLLFVGGIHGGYEWNSVLLAYEFIDYFTTNSSVIPENVKVTVIPVLNPDGLVKIIGKEGRFVFAEAPKDRSVTVPGRFNANRVDLNRNFDCKWQPESTWRGEVVSAGTVPFSEPEAATLRDFVLESQPEAVVFWHSKANTVYASECEEGVLPLTRTIMNTYAGPANYNTVEVFDAYPITGDAEGWLASINIPAITVELETHDSIEWERNLAGTQALINLFSQ